MTVAELWRRGQAGWPRSFPIAQFPNAPLLAAFGGVAVARLTDGSVALYGRAAFYAGLAAWAWLEATHGVNLFRRVVGVAGLVYVVARVGSDLGA